MSTMKQKKRANASEAGVTMIEMVIAIVVLSIGLVSLAQLFIVASFNNSYAIATSGGVNDAQRLVEYWKAIAAADDIDNAAITSSLYDAGTKKCAAFEDLTNEDGSTFDFDASAYKPSVWVFDKDGNVVGTAATLPDGITAGDLRAPSEDSRYVYIEMKPKSNDPRYGQPITLSAVITSLSNKPL